MGLSRTAYADPDSATTMHANARKAAKRVARLSPQRVSAAAPSIRFDNFQQDPTKPQITVSQAAVALAAALHLHLD
ncbi:MAG TPA: hypothetical protein PKK40_07950 [Marmoricola sp.]|nr:hypothetical protein [Marmoricola sp.]